MAITIHSLLSTSPLQPKESQLFEEEVAAFEALEQMGPIEVDGVRVKLVPMLINSQANLLSTWRNSPLRGLAGYSTSDERSFRGLVELFSRALRRSSDDPQIDTILQKLHNRAASLEEERNQMAEFAQALNQLPQNETIIKMAILAAGRALVRERIDAITEGLYLHELSQIAGGSYLVHCKSGYNRTGGMVAALGARHLASVETSEFKEILYRSMQEIGKRVSFMNMGIARTKLGEGFLDNPLLTDYLPEGRSLSDRMR